MKTYTATIPKWKIKVKAHTLAEALAIAGETYDDHRDQDPYFGDIIIKQATK